MPHEGDASAKRGISKWMYLWVVTLQSNLYYLMKLMYGSRMSHPGVAVAICRLARFSSKAKRTLGNLVRFGTIEGRHGLSMLWGNAGSWVASVAGTNVSERRTRVTAGDVRCVPRAPPCVEREYTLSWKKKKIHKIHDFCPILPDSYTNTTYCE